MKYAILIADGMADHPLEELFGKTPLEAAKTLHMDELASQGQVGLCQTVPQGVTPGTDVSTLSILGYDPRRYYSGRGSLEAINIGVDLKEDEIAFRCNLIAAGEDRLVDYSAGHISTEEARVLIHHLNKTLGKKGVRFYPGVSYRHLLVVKKSLSPTGRFEVQAAGPHTLIGKEISPNLPQGEGAELLKELMEASRQALQDHEVNKVRLDLKENPATMIWLWGPGTQCEVPSFKERFGVEGAVISAIDLIKGIGKLVGFEVVKVPGATGYYDTNYVGKAEYALETLKRKDLVLVHLEATDEAGHNGDLRQKMVAIEKFDKLIVGTVVKGLRRSKNVRILIMPDHATLVSTRSHVNDPVPFLLYGKDIASGKARAFSENEAKETGFVIEEGHRLMDTFIFRG